MCAGSSVREIFFHLGNHMSESTLYKHLPNLPDAALQEFTQWCVLEQATASGYKFDPNPQKLENLSPGDYIQELISQFVEATRNTIEGGMAIVVAGQQADKRALPGLGLVVDFISLYVLYLVPQSKKKTQPPEEKLTQASQEQFEKLSEIGKKYGVAI